MPCKQNEGWTFEIFVSKQFESKLSIPLNSRWLKKNASQMQKNFRDNAQVKSEINF